MKPRVEHVVHDNPVRFQYIINEFIENLPKEAYVDDIKYNVVGNFFCALIIYHTGNREFHNDTVSNEVKMSQSEFTEVVNKFSDRPK